MPIADARGLRDEISCLLAELQELNKTSSLKSGTDVIQVEIKGGSF